MYHVGTGPGGQPCRQPVRTLRTDHPSASKLWAHLVLFNAVVGWVSPPRSTHTGMWDQKAAFGLCRSNGSVGDAFLRNT